MKYASSSFIKFEEVKNNGSIRSKIAFVKEGQYGKLDVTLENGRKVGLNGTSVGVLMAELGDDYDGWIGYEVEIYAGSVPYQGSLKDAVLVRPLNGGKSEFWQEMPDEEEPPLAEPDRDDQDPFKS